MTDNNKKTPDEYPDEHDENAADNGDNNPSCPKHGGIMRDNKVTSLFYHIGMGTFNSVQGKPPTFHNEVNKIIEGVYGDNPDYTIIAEKVLKDLDIYLRDTKNVTAIIAGIGMAKPIPGADRVIAALVSKDLLRGYIDARMSWGKESSLKGIEQALREAVQKRQDNAVQNNAKKIAAQSKKKRFKLPKKMPQIKLPKWPKFGP